MRNFIKLTFATILGIFISVTLGILILFGVIGAIINASQSDPTLQSNSVYQIELNGVLVERSEDNPFSSLLGEATGMKEESVLGLDDVLRNIEKAKKEPKIVGIYLNGGSLNGGWAAIKAIRDALIDFKKAGKFVVAYADNYTQKMYYLASIADKVCLNPEGMIELKGLSYETVFFKNTLDKLGIEMQVVKVGTYKSAVEPFIADKMSDASRLQVSLLLNSLWKTISGEIAQARKANTDSINSYADRMMMFQPSLLTKQYALVDSLVYIDEMEDILKKIIHDSVPKGIEFVNHSRLLRHAIHQNADSNKIAIIYAIGDIDGGTGEGIISDNLIDDIQTISEDTSVKSVVLRVNSPGGSAFGAEKIWRALMKLKEKKSVVVSMGDYAASGGYYISCLAHKIVAEPTTITGSIGIFGLIPNVKELNKKIGLSYDEVSTHKMSDFISINRPFTPEEKNIMQLYVNRGYELFVKRCSEGRNISVDSIKSVAEGRIWTGQDAQKIGLVDELGGLTKAIEIAAKMGKLKSFEITEYPKKENFSTKLMKSMKSSLQTRLLRIELGEQYKLLKKIENLTHIKGLQARMPYMFTVK
jgi:protease-4